MAEAKFDVLTIGNAIVDVLAHTEEDFLVREGLVKGSMRLIDGKEADRLFEHMGTTQLVSGGCAGNTAAGVASFGGRAAFIGKVADDELGDSSVTTCMRSASISRPRRSPMGRRRRAP